MDELDYDDTVILGSSTVTACLTFNSHIIIKLGSCCVDLVIFIGMFLFSVVSLDLRF